MLPPPTPELSDLIHRLFREAALHFKASRDNRFKSKPRVVIGSVWEAFVGYPQEFSNWKSATLKQGSPGAQLNRTIKLVKILNGTAGRGALQYDAGEKYKALIDYWSAHHATALTMVIDSLGAYVAELRTAYSTEVVQRYTGKFLPHQRSGVELDHATNVAWDTLGPAPESVRILEENGDRFGARRWLTNHWASCKSWQNLLHHIRLVETAGAGATGLDEFQRLRETLYGEPNIGQVLAERYFVGRVLSQIGEIHSAQQLHNLNLTEIRHSLYRLKSQFEIAQIEFRIENFSRSSELLVNLNKTLMATVEAPIQLRVDVLKFLATLERAHVVFDAPCCESVLSSLTFGSVAACMEYAEQAIKLAREAGYVDGLGWGYVTRAFAYEGRGEFRLAKADFEEGARLHMDPRAHGSSFIYTQLYHSGMLRRQGELDAVKEVLSSCEQHMGDRQRLSHRAELLTQRGLLSAAEGDHEAAANYHRVAIRILANNSSWRARNDWGIVKRIRQVCSTLGCRLEDILTKPGSVEAPK